MGPNFFTYAKTELTNDGLICWLIDWCKYPGSELYGLAMDLLSVFLGKSVDDLHVTDLTIHQQYKNIDMLFEVNGEYLIVIEDKIDSKEHSDQLRQYRAVIDSDFPHYSKEKQNFIYLKIGDQSSYKEVHSAGYRLVHREDLIRIFSNHTYIKHPLIRQYAEHLSAIQKEVASFSYLPIHQWNSRAWHGFYKELQAEKKLADSHWGYVSNSNGGFWGFWWNYTPFPSPTNPEFWTYLQIEENRITFKVEIADPNRPGNEKSAIRNQVWNAFHSLLQQEAESAYLPVKTRFRQGTWMSIAEITPLQNCEAFHEAIASAENLINQLNQELHSPTKD